MLGHYDGVSKTATEKANQSALLLWKSDQSVVMRSAAPVA